MIRSLPEVVAPLPVQDFISFYNKKEFCHVKGWPGKFTALLTWSALNRLLLEHQLDYPRLRVSQEGRMFTPDSFLLYVESARDARVFYPRLQETELTKHLREGATLVVDRIDEIHNDVMTLADELERAFHTHIQINAFVSWRTTNGFRTHWDDHDILILQTTGRKYWRIYGMTTPYPRSEDVSATYNPPQTPPVWEGMIEDGDLLYIPRGWWHSVTPVDEPTLHLAVGILESTVVDLLTWLGQQLEEDVTFRMDMPRFASAAEQAAYVNNLRAALLKLCGDDLLRKFSRHMDGIALPRPRLSLPWSAIADVLPAAPDARFQLNSPRPLDITFDAEQGTLLFFANGKRWEFAREALEVLRLFEAQRVCSFSHLYEAAGGSLDHETLRELLRQLVSNGLICVLTPEQGNNARYAHMA